MDTKLVFLHCIKCQKFVTINVSLSEYYEIIDIENDIF